MLQVNSVSYAIKRKGGDASDVNHAGDASHASDASDGAMASHECQKASCYWSSY